jgi:hypothetical protein
MKLPKLRESAPLRMALLILVVGFLDCFAVLFPKPVLAAALIPGLIPILAVPLVVMPLLAEEKRREQKR